MANCKSCNNNILKNKNIFCNIKCQNDFNYKEYIKRWKLGLEDGMRGAYNISKHIRRYLFEKYNNKCLKCNWNEINAFTGLVPLEIEHIDGNFQNNKEENLVLLCPNCHALTETYKALNKGNGRLERKRYYKPL